MEDTDVDGGLAELACCFEFVRFGVDCILDGLFADAAQVGGGGGGSYVSVRLLHGGEFVLVEGVGHFNDWLMWAPSGADNGCRGGVGDAGCEYSGVRCFLVGLGSGWWGGISA